MSLFEKLEPTVLKEDSSIQKQIDKLKEILPKASEPVQEAILQDIHLLEIGLYGENRIMFELKNSHIPMYILHDLYFEKDGLSAQIDYLVICPQLTYIIECKNLFGNIEINSNGDFIRTVQFGKKYKKEGIYSPITQNIRHLELMKSMSVDSKFDIFANWLMGDSFMKTHIPVVVLANEKTVLNDRYAKKEVKEQVIKLDHLIQYIRECEKATGTVLSKRSYQNMRDCADAWLKLSSENPADYIEKYRVMEREHRARQRNEIKVPAAPKCPNCNIDMVKRIAQSGPRKGKEFWGCPNYPRCKNIINID